MYLIMLHETIHHGYPEHQASARQNQMQRFMFLLVITLLMIRMNVMLVVNDTKQMATSRNLVMI